jgi:hypothetical protein
MIFETTTVAEGGWIDTWVGTFPGRSGVQKQNPRIRFEAGETLRVCSDALSLAALVLLDSRTVSGQLMVLPFGPTRYPAIAEPNPTTSESADPSSAPRR